MGRPGRPRGSRTTSGSRAASRATSSPAGRSSKRGDLDYSIAGYERFLDRFLAHVGADRYRLVMHDWGVVGLALAQAAPQRVERLVVMNIVPFLPGYRWHRIARIWRTPGLGELAMGTTNRFTLRLTSREANATKGPMPEMRSSPAGLGASPSMRVIPPRAQRVMPSTAKPCRRATTA